MKKKLILVCFFLIALIYGCEKKEVNNVDSNFDSEENTSASSSLKTSPGALYFVDRIQDINDPSGPGDVTPETCKIIPGNTGWKFNDAGTKIIAYGSVKAYFNTKFGDVEISNSYAIGQVILVKDNQIYNDCADSIFDEGEQLGLMTWDPPTMEETANASTQVYEFEFPFTDRASLNGVTIVSQGLLFGCFAENRETPPQSVKVDHAADTRALFDLTIPPPTTPDNVSIDESNIIVSWDTSLYTDSYDVYRKQDSGNWYKIGSTTNTSYRDWDVVKLPDDYTFYYKVKAVNTTGVSSFSSSVSTMGNTFF